MINHLALIMDGNRRWAKKRLLQPWLGHKEGLQVAQMAVQYCLDYKIPYVSLYALSLENLHRSPVEVSYLFSLLYEVKKNVDEWIAKGVAVRIIGDLSQAPEDIQVLCSEIVNITARGTVLQCSILFCYGSQQEIIDGVQRVIREKGIVHTADDFKKYLWFGSIPDPTLIIRTGGVKRLSNFLLFQAAYSEIRFLDCLWPDLTQDILHATVLDCINAQKNFGL